MSRVDERHMRGELNAKQIFQKGAEKSGVCGHRGPFYVTHPKDKNRKSIQLPKRAIKKPTSTTNKNKEKLMHVSVASGENLPHCSEYAIPNICGAQSHTPEPGLGAI